MSDVSKPTVERLLRGISTNDVETVRDAWRALLAIGPEAVPAVRDKLDGDAWSENPRGPLSRYLGVLLALLDELDADTFARVVDLLQAGKLHPIHRRTVELMARRITDAPAGEIGPGIPVYVARDVENHGLVIDRLTRWSRTPGLDLGTVSRIDVIAMVPSMDYLGLYNLFFSGIILAWPATPRRGFAGWFDRIQQEFTFYHEIGHHACGHIEGGTVVAQEDEADAYARRMFRRAHPIMIALARGPAWLAGNLLFLLVSKEALRRAGVRDATD